MDCPADSIKSLWRSFEGIIGAVEDLTESEDPKTKIKAHALLKRVHSFEFMLMLMFMKNVMVKMKILTHEIQSIKVNILDNLEAAQATVFTLKHMRDNSNTLNEEIQAAVVFSEKFGIDGQAEYQKHHIPRRQPNRPDERPENAALFNPSEYYCKEFVQILDVQISSLTDNLRVPLDILPVVVNLLEPSFLQKIDQKDCQLVINMLPEGL
eukprot:gene16281-17919_t